MSEKFVIDISKYQGKIDFAKVKKAGVHGVIIRCAYRGYASNGAIATDPYFYEYVKGCVANGLDWGVYFFSQAKNYNEGVEEANYTVKLLESVKPNLPSFPIYIDTEKSSHPLGLGRADKISKVDRTNAVKGFCNRLEALGYFSGVYSGTNWFNTMLNDGELLKYAHWVAHYATKCGYTKEHGMWQYSSSGGVAGISGRVDMNKCYVDYPTIIKKVGLNGYTKPVVNENNNVVKTFIAKATQGDIDALVKLAKELKLEYNIE